MSNPLTLVRDNPLTLQVGSTEVISASGNLDVTDTDYSDAQLTYTIVSGPSDGVLLDNGVAATSFTQADLDNGLVSYHETASSPSTDNFAFSVSDPGGNEISGTFNIITEQAYPLTQSVPELLTTYAALSTAVTGVQINYNGYSNEQFTTVVTTGAGTLLAFAGNSGATVSNSGSGSVSITGTAAQVNAVLKTLDYIGASSGSNAITVSTIDLGDENTVSKTISVIVEQAGEFVSLDDPLASNGTLAYGINNEGQIVGYYNSDSSLAENGFVHTDGTFEAIDDPALGNGNPFDLVGTLPQSINDAGQIAGYEQSASSNEGGSTSDDGFVYSSGVFQTQAQSGQSGNFDVFFESINNQDEVVGYFNTTPAYNGVGGQRSPTYVAFIYEDGTFQYIGSTGAQAFGVNNEGQVVGNFGIYSNGVFSALPSPGGLAYGINDAGVIVGVSGTHGFAYNENTGAWTFIDIPGATATEVYGINDSDQIVGTYRDANGILHGFVGTVPPQFPTNPGNNDEWILSNGQWLASAGPGSHPSGYQVAAVGDFTDSGTDGILWYNPSTGDVDEWKISYGAWAGSIDLGTHPGSYQIAGVGDFTGNGTNDVLWTSASGNGQVQTDIWELNNGQWAASVSPGSHPAGYQVAGIGDWTGDGTDGVLWYNSTTGDVDEWQLNSGQWSASVDLGSHPGTGWTIAGVGDFFDNGRDDVLWTGVNSNGTVSTDIWELGSNGQWINSISPGTHPAGYQVVGVGDFTGNGTSDILWQNPTTGDVDEWLINNGKWSDSVDLGTHPGSAQIAGIGDFTGNGTSNILWHSNT